MCYGYLAAKPVHSNSQLELMIGKSCIIIVNCYGFKHYDVYKYKGYPLAHALSSHFKSFLGHAKSACHVTDGVI